MTPTTANSLRVFVPLAAIGALAMAPELAIFFSRVSQTKALLSTLYYVAITSFLLTLPACWLPRPLARAWCVTTTTLTGLATLVTGFQAFSLGARWDITAHTAMMQTYTQQVLDFSRFFGSWQVILALVLVAAAFVFACIMFWSAKPISRRLATLWTVGGLIASSYGIYNFVKYEQSFTHEAIVSDGTTLALATNNRNSYHPLVRIAFTHHNYKVTHDYYIAAYQRAIHLRDRLKGAIPAEGAIAPRIVVVVVGESASRRHWSLYGYERDTTPRLDALRDELLIFDDAVTICVGTQASIRQMFDTNVASLPVFALFSEAGYTTHWLSSKQDQGAHDVEIAALVQTCDYRLFLNGAYDEILLPHVQQVLESPGRHVIFVNLFGSHVAYQDRYPPEHNFFKGSGKKQTLIATYDNSIRYTDFILGNLIDMLRARDESSCLLYLSDHAEDVYASDPERYLFRADSLATDPMYEIPFVAWFSAHYRQENPGFIAAATQQQQKPFQTPGLYHSVIDLTRLTHPIFDPKRSVFSPHFEETVRRVGNMERIYTRPPRTPASR